MALSDILASLRDYFTGGQSEQDRAEEQAAALAEQTANIVTGNVTPMSPAPFAPQVPNFDNQSIDITPIQNVTTVSPALQAADVALQAAQAGTNVQQPQITLPEAPAPAIISPAPSAPQVEFGAGTNIAAPASPALQEASALLPAGIQSTPQQPEVPITPVETIFTPPEILPTSGTAPQKNSTWDEIKAVGSALLDVVTLGIGEAKSRDDEEKVKQEFGYAPSISFRDKTNVIAIGKIYKELKTTNDVNKQQEIVNAGLKDTGYNGPSKTPAQFIEFYSKLQNASPEGRSPVNVKSLDEELAGRYGVDVEYAKGVIARDTYRINVVRSQLESELVKLLPPRSEFAGDEQNRVAEVIAQFQGKADKWMQSKQAIEFTWKNSLINGGGAASGIKTDVAIANKLTDAYMERYSKLILEAQKAAIKSDAGGKEAANVGIDAIATYLRENGFSSVNEYMNDGLPVIDNRIAPESNLQLQAANASAEADKGVVNSLYVTENLLSVYAVEGFKNVFGQRKAAEQYIEGEERFTLPEASDLPSLLRIFGDPGYAINKITDIVKPYSRQNALEGVSDMQYVNQVLTPEKITSTRQSINYLAQNAPEILGTIAVMIAGNYAAGALELGYIPEASRAAKLARWRWNAGTESLLIGEAVNGVAGTTQPAITKEQALANTIVNLGFDMFHMPVQAAAAYFPKGSIIRDLAPKIITIGDDLGDDGLRNVAAYRQAKRELTHDASRVAASPEEQTQRLDARIVEINPKLSQEDVSAVASLIKRAKVAARDIAKQDPELANQILKGSLAKGKVFEDVRSIISSTGGLTDQAKLQIADLQRYYNSLVGDDAINVADMVRQIYGIDAPVYYAGFYSGLLPQEIKNIPGIATEGIQYSVPGKVYDVVGNAFNPNNVAPQQMENLKVLFPEINVVAGTNALDDASKNALGIVETKQFKLAAATAKSTDDIVDNLIVKGIIEENNRGATNKLAALVERTASKILCP